MKTRLAVLPLGTVFAALLALATSARADDFMDACVSGANGGTGMTQTCNCIAGKIPAGQRADAAAALVRSNRSMQEGGKPLDPSSLTPNQMRGLQAYVLAQSECM